jgi:hypothetical protein
VWFFVLRTLTLRSKWIRAGAIVEVITDANISSEEITSQFDKAVAHTATQPPTPQPVARPAGPTHAPSAPVPTGVPSPSTNGSASASAQTPPSAEEKKQAYVATCLKCCLAGFFGTNHDGMTPIV